MPTGSDYRRAATRFDDLAVAVLNDARRWGSTTPVELGGHAPELARATALINSISPALVLSSGALRELASICRRRAAICDDYERRLTRWHRTVAAGGIAAIYPIPPAPWVTV